MKLRRAGIGALTVLVVAGAVACGSGSNDTGAPTTSPVVAAPGSTGTSSRSSDSLVTGTTGDPGTTVASPESPASNPDAPSASSSVPGGSPSTSATTPTTKAGSTPVTLPSGQSIPPGTSAEDKAWCVKAKPVSAALLTILTLNLQQFQALVDSANALIPSAPAAVKPPLTFLQGIGARFLAAVQAGKATISDNGILVWANANLTQAQQTEFLQDAGSVTNYINATC